MTTDTPHTPQRQGNRLAAAPESDELVADLMAGSTCYSETNDIEFRRIMTHAHVLNQKDPELLR